MLEHGQGILRSRFAGERLDTKPDPAGWQGWLLVQDDRAVCAEGAEQEHSGILWVIHRESSIWEWGCRFDPRCRALVIRIPSRGPGWKPGRGHLRKRQLPHQPLYRSAGLRSFRSPDRLPISSALGRDRDDTLI